MKGIPVILLLVLGLVAVSEAWKDYSPEDSEDYSSEETYDQGDEYDAAELLDQRSLSDNSMKYLQDDELADDRLQEPREFADESTEYLDAVTSLVRNRRGRGGDMRSSMRKIGKSMLKKKPKTQMENNNEDDTDSTMVEGVVDDNLTYVTRRPLPDEDRNEPIPRSLAEQVLQIMKDINGLNNKFEIPMSGGMKCSSSYPALGEHMPYSASQLTIKMDVIVNTDCSYFKSSSTNQALTTASVTFTMSPEPHFIITKIEVEPETENDFRSSIGSQNNPMDTIFQQSVQLINLYLKESIAAVFYSLKRLD